MNRTATATARHHTYVLLSQLYLNGVTTDLLPYLAQISELAAASHPFDQDEAAASHYRVFIHNIFPYESIFRDPSGLLGGSITDQVKAFYENAGILFSDDADHIGHELAFLAILCMAEATAGDTQAQENSSTSVRQQRDFLSEHLLHWLPPLISSLSFIEDPFYQALGQLTQNIVYDHFLAVGLGLPAQSAVISETANIPDIIHNEQTGLKQIAGFLSTPPHSGLYLSGEMIAILAKRQQLPRGFGSRRQMLSNLLHTAAQYDLIPELLEDLTAHTVSWAQKYQQQIVDFPEMKPWVQSWLERVENTKSILIAMRNLTLTTS